MILSINTGAFWSRSAEYLKAYWGSQVSLKRFLNDVGKASKDEVLENVTVPGKATVETRQRGTKVSQGFNAFFGGFCHCLTIILRRQNAENKKSSLKWLLFSKYFFNKRGSEPPPIDTAMAVTQAEKRGCLSPKRKVTY